MTKQELARRLADANATTPAAAADRLDAMVFDVLKKLRAGKAASVPGLGRISNAEPTPKPRKRTAA